ncbi:glycosyl transferase family 9, partial [bacterium]|nr:glycosyl transferase family 9 [bacterium]
IQDGSEFERKLGDLVASIRPRSIIETGTYLGTGTTRIIASALRDSGLAATRFVTIECHPHRHRQAVNNLTGAGLSEYVAPLCGLSVPRALLPSEDQIRRDTVENVGADNDIFVDHQEADRVALYHGETNFPDIPDDLLGRCLAEFDDSPDMILLDSAGHMGNVEFNYVIERLKGECHIVLDDIKHIKHHRSFQQLKTDPRFTIITASNEKFGFCIAKFTPDNLSVTGGINRILWVRTDSIGDSVLAMAMLPHVRDKYPGAEITVLCQEHVAELYEASPFVNQVIAFNRRRALQEEEYRTALLGQLQRLRADLCLNTVYSREPLTDFFAVGCGARQRIALNGNLCNMSAAERENNNRHYTSVLPSEGEHKNELERHRDFLLGLDKTVDRLDLTLWVTPDDIAYADALCNEHGLVPEETIALFAGAQYAVRLYDYYGKALAPFCKDSDYSVIALGAAQDFEINQHNLDATGAKTVNLSGALTLRQCAALLSRCRLAVGAETGLAHMACAVDTPNVILLGGGHFGRFMPYSPLTSIVSLPLDCYGCNWQCRYGRVHCVREVKPETITEAVRKTLAEASDTTRFFVQGSFDSDSTGPQPKCCQLPDWLMTASAKVIPVP